jgi:beta-lactamase regulating signal transducer with metallopeptidase domain/HEAT repeat protein
MNGLWAVLLMNSLVAGVIAVAATIVMRVMKRPALAHVLWLLVLAKLITPPLWTVHMPWHAGVPNVELQHEPVTAAEPSRDLLSVIPPRTIEVGIIPNDARPSPSSPTTAVEAAPGMTINYAVVILCVWIGGSVLSLIVLTRRVRRLRRVLSLSDPASPDLLARVRVLGDRFGLKSAPDFRLIPLDVSPAVCWLGGLPVLLIPRTLFAAMSGVERDALVAHELAHVRRRDHWVRAFEAVVGVVFWWHPLLWLAVREIRDAEEQCCDAWVVWALPHRGPDYANALVTTLDFVSRRNNELVPLSSGMGRLGHLERRLTMICTRPAPRTLSPFGRLVVAGALLALPLMPVPSPTARAQQEQKDIVNPGAKRSNEDVAVAALIDACRDADEEVRSAAFESLTQFKEAAVPALLDALANEAKRPIAIGAFQRISYPALPGLLKGLEDRDARTRAAVAEAISQTLVPDGAYFPPQPHQHGVMPGMAPGAGMGGRGGFGGGYGGSMAGMPAVGIQGMSIDTAEELQRFESIRKQTAAALAKAIEDPDAAVRRHVTIALGKIGADADVVVPALLAALKDRDAEVRRFATQALVPAAHASPATVTPALVAALKDPDAGVRSAASLGLLNLGSSAKEALPALVELLRDEDPAVRRMAAAAIGRVRNDPKAEQPSGSGYDPGAGSPSGGRRGR